MTYDYVFLGSTESPGEKKRRGQNGSAQSKVVQSARTPLGRNRYGQEINVCIKELASSPDDIKMPPANTARQFSPRVKRRFTEGMMYPFVPRLSPLPSRAPISKEFWLYFLAFILPRTRHAVYLIKRNYISRVGLLPGIAPASSFIGRCSCHVFGNNASSSFA